MIADISYAGLFGITVVAFLVPLVLAMAPRLSIPPAVVEILAGLILGPAVLNWIKLPDDAIHVMADLGVGFLLFLAGMEIELTKLKGRSVRLAVAGFVLSFLLALLLTLPLAGIGFVLNPLLVSIILVSTSLGVVAPILKDSGLIHSTFGQMMLAEASVAEFGSILLLSFLFSGQGSNLSTKIVLIAVFAGLIALIGLGISDAAKFTRVSNALFRLQDTTSQIRIRGAVMLLIGMLALASELRLDAILGAFLAGVMLSVVDRDLDLAYGNFRQKLEGLGYGFFVPVFFISVGLGFDAEALFASPSNLLRVPLFLGLMLLIRGLPALLYRPVVGTRRTVVAGLLQATSLTFVVVGAQIGLQLHQLRRENAAALIAAGMLSVLIFPAIALGLLKRDARAEEGADALEPVDTPEALEPPPIGEGF